MKRFIYILLALAFFVVTYIVLNSAFPKMADRIPLLLILFVIDFYLWYSIRKDLRKLKQIWRYFIATVYWLPFAVMLVMGTALLIAPYYNWSGPLTVYAFGISFIFYVSKLLAVIFFLIVDLVRIVEFTIRFARSKKNGKPFREDVTAMSRARFLRTVGLASGGLLLSGMLIGVVKWAYDFRIRREYLKIPFLPKSFDKLRIVQISDLHLGSWISSGPMDEAVRLINSLDPDVVLFTGDLVNSTTSEAIRFRESLSSIRAPEGIFAVLGNHDYGDYVNWPDEESKARNLHMLYDFYAGLGWKLLNNENHILRRGNEEIAILGVENWSKNRRFPRLGDMKKAMKGAEDKPVKILMSHDPTHWEVEVSQKYPDIDLTLSGHTHGFQFGVEFKGFKWSLAQYVYKFWAGLYSQNGNGKEQFLYVNRGLGMIGYPGRVGILPEITLLELSRG